MIRHHFELRETIATIVADEQTFIEAAEKGIIEARQAVERCIAKDPYFAATFEPYRPDSDAPVVVRMADAAEKAGVGPMAAVAGAIAWSGLEAMQERGAEFGIIDNGGDIALISDREVLIGVHAGNSPLSNRVAFALPPSGRVLGVCTSSATVGPSISLGIADAVTVFSPDVALSDAWATAICNEIRPDDMTVFTRLSPDEVRGVFVVINENTVTWGDTPPLVRAKFSSERITAGIRF